MLQARTGPRCPHASTTPTRLRGGACLGKEETPNEGGEPADLEGIFKVWIDSDLKVQILVFFHQNPGMIETPEGLAKRMGLNLDRLRDEIADHIRLGIITERRVGGRTILVYNPSRDRDISREIENAINAKMKGDGQA
jgi:hypothetical protein